METNARIIILGSARNMETIRAMEKHATAQKFEVLSWLNHFGGVRSESQGYVPGSDGLSDELRTLNLIRRTDVVVALVPAGLTTAFELGIAYEIGKDIVLVGTKEQSRQEGVYLVAPTPMPKCTGWAVGIQLMLNRFLNDNCSYDVTTNSWVLRDPDEHNEAR